MRHRASRMRWAFALIELLMTQAETGMRILLGSGGFRTEFAIRFGEHGFVD
jgi:hypothetical protein